jgi:hypothetical protein
MVESIVEPIVAAIAAGAVAGLQDDAAQAMRDAYGRFKAHLRASYPQVDLTPIEQGPASPVTRAALAVDLDALGAAEDADLREWAEWLLSIVEHVNSAAPASVDIDVADVRARFVRIERLGGPTVRVEMNRLEATEGVTVSDIRGGAGGADPNS